jgi:hypothetical protein
MDYTNSKKSWQESKWLYFLMGVLIIIVGSLLWYFISLILPHNPTNPTVEINNSNVSVTTQIIKEIYSSSPLFEIKTDNYSPISLYSEYGVNKTNVEKIIDNIIQNKNLQPLPEIDSDKSIKDIPEGTYFFIAASYLDSYSFLYKDYLQQFFYYPPVDSNRELKNYYFEVLYPSKNEAYLIGFISQDLASLTKSLDGNSEKEIMLFPEPINQRDVLIVIPINRIIKINQRDITLDGERTSLLDLTIK